MTAQQKAVAALTASVANIDMKVGLSIDGAEKIGGLPPYPRSFDFHQPKRPSLTIGQLALRQLTQNLVDTDHFVQETAELRLHRIGSGLGNFEETRAEERRRRSYNGGNDYQFLPGMAPINLDELISAPVARRSSLSDAYSDNFQEFIDPVVAEGGLGLLPLSTTNLAQHLLQTTAAAGKAAGNTNLTAPPSSRTGIASGRRSTGSTNSNTSFPLDSLPRTDLVRSSPAETPVVVVAQDPSGIAQSGGRGRSARRPSISEDMLPPKGVKKIGDKILAHGPISPPWGTAGHFDESLSLLRERAGLPVDPHVARNGRSNGLPPAPQISPTSTLTPPPPASRQSAPSTSPSNSNSNRNPSPSSSSFTSPIPTAMGSFARRPSPPLANSSPTSPLEKKTLQRNWGSGISQSGGEEEEEEVWILEY